MGTVTGCGPLDTFSATALPGATDVPAAGVCDTTLPEGADALNACVIVAAVSLIGVELRGPFEGVASGFQ